MAFKLLVQTGEKEMINRSIVCFEKLIVLKCCSVCLRLWSLGGILKESRSYSVFVA